MTQENKRAVAILVAAVVVIIAGVAIWWLYFRADSVTNENLSLQPDTTNIAVVNATVNSEPTVNQDSAVEAEELALERVARFFTERFGSYSSDADYQNILDLKPYMTDKMEIWADDFVRVQRAAGIPNVFTSITTRVLSTPEFLIDGERATIRFTTQRVEEGPVGDTYYQEIILVFIKKDGEWHVDTATWQDKGVVTTTTESSSSNVNISTTDPEEVYYELHPEERM